MRIEAFPSEVDLELRAQIKEFIINITSGARAHYSLPLNFSLFVDGKPRRVIGGPTQITSDYIYIGQSGNESVTEVAVLAAIATLFSLEDDQEVKDSLQTYINKMILGLVILKGGHSAATLDDRAIMTLAIKGSRIAALVGDSYHLENGEKIEVDNEWTIFQIPS